MLLAADHSFEGLVVILMVVETVSDLKQLRSITKSDGVILVLDAYG